jgi:hypothetical protein
VNASFIRELLRRAAVYAADGRAARAAARVPSDGLAPSNGSVPSAGFAPPHGSVNRAAPSNGPALANGAAADQAPPLRVSARHLNLALDELLGSQHDLTRVLLGSRPMRGADAVIRPVWPHLRPTR